MKMLKDLVSEAQQNQKGLTLSDAVDRTLDQNGIQGHGRDNLHKKICQAIKKETAK